MRVQIEMTERILEAEAGEVDFRNLVNGDNHGFLRVTTPNGDRFINPDKIISIKDLHGESKYTQDQKENIIN